MWYNLKNFTSMRSTNLDNILKSYLGYHDLQGLRNSFDYKRIYLQWLGNLVSQHFFVVFTFAERLWDLVIKALHALHSSKLNLSNKIKNLQLFHITELTLNDVMTCAKYYGYKTFFPHKLMTKK
jgi:hypothetical protein